MNKTIAKLPIPNIKEAVQRPKILNSKKKDGNIKFLTFLRKDRRVYVESIGFDDFIFKLLYASRTYLNKMDKYKAKEYLSNRKCIEDEGFMKVIRAI